MSKRKPSIEARIRRARERAETRIWDAVERSMYDLCPKMKRADKGSPLDMVVWFAEGMVARANDPTDHLCTRGPK